MEWGMTVGRTKTMLREIPTGRGRACKYLSASEYRQVNGALCVRKQKHQALERAGGQVLAI